MNAAVRHKIKTGLFQYIYRVKVENNKQRIGSLSHMK